VEILQNFVAFSEYMNFHFQFLTIVTDFSRVFHLKFKKIFIQRL
jgi:hypothetical protein